MVFAGIHDKTYAAVVSPKSANERVRAVEYISYSVCDIGVNLPVALSEYFLLTFYTDVALLPLPAIGAFLFLYRVFDMGNDAAAALFINRFTFSKGKYRVYLLWLSVPFAVLTSLVYQAPNFNASGKIAYAVITLFLWEVLYTLLATSLDSVLPYISVNAREREKLNSAKCIGAVGGYLLVSAIALKLMSAFGGANTRAGYSVTSILFAAASIPMLVFGYFNIKERHYQSPKLPATIKEIAANTFTNKKLGLIFLMYACFCMANSFKNQMTIYFVIYKLNKNIESASLIITIGVIASFAMQIIIPFITRFFNREKFMTFGLIAAVCSMIFAAGQRSLLMFALCNVAYGVFSAIPANLVFISIADLTDEAFAEKGLHIGDIYLSALSMASKIGKAAAALMCSIVMSYTGYAPNAPHQSALVISGISVLFIGGTAFMQVMSSVFMGIFAKKANFMRSAKI